MKKYAVHFIYILIIAALAIASRLKTNDLQQQVEVAQQAAMNAQAEAEMMAQRAEAQAALALKEAEKARAAQLEAERLIQEIKKK